MQSSPPDSSIKKTGILYLSYDGMLEPLGESQVLGYLNRMCQDRDFEFTLLSFEKSHDLDLIDHFKRLKALTQKNGIDWIPLRYHKAPVLLATAYDIGVCTLQAIRVLFRKKIDIIHARSYVTAVTALILKIFFKKKFIFDMRGFWADERADAGQWPRSGRVYRSVKWFEKQFLLHADAVVSLTQAGVDEMKSFPYLKGRDPNFTVIPTCADLDQFQISADSSLRTTYFWIGHIGSIGNWYLFEEALLFFRALRSLEPRARLLILNRNEHEKILKSLGALNIPLEAYELKSAHHHEMSEYLSRLSASVFFIKPLYSKKASAPTKLAELLGCGVPCVVNSGVGDMDLLFRERKVGVCISNYEESTLLAAAEKLLALKKETDVSETCRTTAFRYFSADQGAKDYLALYRQILLP